MATNKIKLTNTVKEIPLSAEEQEKMAVEKKARNDQYFLEEVEYSIKNRTAKIDKFRADLADNALYAMEWSNEVFSAAAELFTYKFLQATIKELGLEEARNVVREHAVREAFRGAKWPSHSTSAASNLAAEAKVSAWARMAETLGFKA